MSSSNEMEKLVSEFVEARDKAKMEIFENLISVQKPLCKDSAGNYDMYMIGLYNGLQIGLGILTDKEPVLYSIEKEEDEDVSE